MPTDKGDQMNKRLLGAAAALLVAIGGLVTTGIATGPALADYGAMSCTTAVWTNSGNFQINNRCNRDIVVILHSGTGQCTGGCRHHLSVNGYYMYTIGGDIQWFSCASYETPVSLSRTSFRCD